MNWKQHSASNSERRVHELQMKLLRVNAELRLKTIYAERLEVLLRQRHERIDALFAQLERAYAINRRLEAECDKLDTENKCLTALIAAALAPTPQLIARAG